MKKQRRSPKYILFTLLAGAVGCAPPQSRRNVSESDAEAEDPASGGGGKLDAAKADPKPLPASPDAVTSVRLDTATGQPSDTSPTDAGVDAPLPSPTVPDAGATPPRDTAPPPSSIDAAVPRPVDAAKPASPDTRPPVDTRPPKLDASVVPVPGLVLHWTFDDDGLVARDTSGNGFDGTLTGDQGAPFASTNVPVVIRAFSSQSLDFVAASGHQVLMNALPAALRPESTVSISVWYHATHTAGPFGGFLAAAGAESYSLRVKPTSITVSRRLGPDQWNWCDPETPGHLDGNWHHVVGVLEPTLMTLYVDGKVVCTLNDARPQVYDDQQTFRVGRNGNGAADGDFEGGIDDLRVYNKALQLSDVALLYQGAR